MNEKLLLKKLFSTYKKLPFISSFQKIPQYHDEPRIYQYSARSIVSHRNKKNVIGGVGTSFSENQSKIKAIAEAIERISLMENPKKILKKPKNLKNIISFNDLPEFYNNPLNDKIIKSNFLNWIKGYKVKNPKGLGEVFIPAQMVFVPYKFRKREPVIRQSISTGAASGINYTDVILRGILEVIERDAFIISYYQKGINCKIDVTADKKIKTIIEEIKRCKLEPFIFDISSDTGPYVFLSIIIDRTGFGPPVSAGLKAGYNPRQVAIDCIEESLHSRSWIRDIMFKLSKEGNKDNKIKQIITIKDSALFWLNPKLLGKISFYLNHKKIKKLKIFKNKTLNSQKSQLIQQISKLKSLGTEVYFVDITGNNINTSFLKTVKVIVTKLQPLFLDERYKCLNGSRLKGENLNKTPHFFL